MNGDVAESRRARERGVSDAAVRAGTDTVVNIRGRQGHLVHDRTDPQQRPGRGPGDHLTLVEAPSEARTLAVISEG